MKIDTKKLVALIREVVEEEVNNHLGLNEMGGVPVEKNGQISAVDAKTSHPAAISKLRMFVTKNVASKLKPQERMSFNAEAWLDKHYSFRQEDKTLYLLPKEGAGDPIGQGVLKFVQGKAEWAKNESVTRDSGRWVKVDIITETRLSLLNTTLSVKPATSKVVSEVYDGDGATCMGCDRPLMDDYKDASGVMCDDCFSGTDDQLDSVEDEFQDMRLADEEKAEQRQSSLPRDYESPTIDDDLEFERDLDDDLDESVIHEADESLREPGNCANCGRHFEVENVQGPSGRAAGARSERDASICQLCLMKQNNDRPRDSWKSSMTNNAKGISRGVAGATGFGKNKKP